MMRIFSIFSFLLLFSLSAFAQKSSFWTDVAESQMKLAPSSERTIFPTKQRTLTLDLDAMKKVLANAPMEYTPQSKTEAVKLEMPLPDGSFETFEVWETQTMQPKLASKYSYIRTYMGRNRETGSVFTMDYGQLGFHGSIMTLDNSYYIDPYASRQQEFYMVYDVKDDLEDWGRTQKLACGYTEADAANDFSNGIGNLPNVQERILGEQQELKTFILAMSCTGEFGAQRGDSIPDIIQVFNTVASRLNQIYQLEVAVKMVLHENTERLIWLNGAADPYPIPDVGIELLGINNNVVNARIPVDSYDIGNVMTNRCSDVGGVASGTNACIDGRKAGGVTCNGGGLNISTLAHEMGHQNSVSHSWDNCPGSDGQRASQSSFEPGSGTTIMSYSGACGNQNIGADDDYFSNGSVEQFINYAHDRQATCGTVSTPGNTKPDIHWTYENGFSIPMSTPFELIGDATDDDGDQVLYCWEQHDLRAIPTPIGFPAENAPMWRSYPPNTNPIRSFPITRYVLDPDAIGRPVIEQLPDYEREYNFTLSVRDRDPEAGANVWEQVTFDVSGEAGPFMVTSQADAATTDWTVGKEVEITWDPAGTNEAPVNCDAIDIWLSISNGNFFGFKILENTPNDGSEIIFVPDNVTTRARLKLKCSDNIFFNVNEAIFEIKEATEPGFTAKVSPGYYYACLPQDANVAIETGSVLNYAEMLNVEIESPIPNGITATFDKSQVVPGETANLSLEMTNDLGSGATTLDIIIYGDGTDTVRRQVELEYFRNDFSSIKTTGPGNGLAGIEELPTLTWTSSPDAQTFDIQVATNPAFGANDLIYEEFNLTDTFYLMPDLLEENTPYYWRIRPANDCGAGDYLVSSSFHTVAKKCQSLIGLEGDVQRVPIPGSGLPTIQSSVSILEPGTINDINIPSIQGSYEPLNSIRISLISPDSTRAILFERRCNGSVFNFGFDDAIANRNPCPANDGRVRGPQDRLSIFNGRELTGSWTLEVDVQAPGVGGGGSLEEWELEFCADLALKAPTLLVNDTLPVQFGLGEKVARDYLETIDDVDDPWNITYTVVSLPKFGELNADGEPVKIGDQFTQKYINDGRVWYVHDGVSIEQFDDFTFTIRDSEGGWLATPQFNFKLDLETVGVDDINPELQDQITIFPNPANNVLNIQIDRVLKEEVNIQLFNAQGKLMKNQVINNPDAIIKMDISDMTDGFYFLSFTTEKGRATKSLVVEK